MREPFLVTRVEQRLTPFTARATLSTRSLRALRAIATVPLGVEKAVISEG